MSQNHQRRCLLLILLVATAATRSSARTGVARADGSPSGDPGKQIQDKIQAMSSKIKTCGFENNDTATLLCLLGLKPPQEGAGGTTKGTCVDEPQDTSVVLCLLGLKKPGAYPPEGLSDAAADCLYYNNDLTTVLCLLGLEDLLGQPSVGENKNTIKSCAAQDNDTSALLCLLGLVIPGVGWDNGAILKIPPLLKLPLNLS